MRFRHTDRPGFLLGLTDFMTAGLFFLLYMPFGGLQDELEEILGHKLRPYWKVYLLGVPTLFVYTLIWMSRIAEELKEKAVSLGIEGPLTSWRHMFGWNVFGLLLFGPAVATERFFDTLNKVERELNRQAGPQGRQDQKRGDFMEKQTNDIAVLTENRERVIVKTSVVGIATNLLLVAFKAFVGLASHSIAVILDAVNNFSDALSSVVTIIGAKLGGKLPDKKHPLGYGRVEYLSSMAVAALVLYAGLTSLVESVKKILRPEAAEYSAVSLVIIAVAIAVKLILGLYVRRQGKRVNSGALEASGSDALFDAILSASVLASAGVYLIWGLSLEAWVGVVIAIFILRAGVEMMIETLNDIIGKREDAETTKELKRIICEEDDVLGAYDVTLFNYGPSRNYGSVHIELPDTLTVDAVDRITRRIQQDVFRRTGIILTGIGVYSFNTSDDEAAQMRNAVRKAVLSHDWALQMHGFYADTERRTLRFDVVLSFDVERKEALETLYGEIRALYPDYDLLIVPDVDVAD